MAKRHYGEHRNMRGEHKNSGEHHNAGGRSFYSTSQMESREEYVGSDPSHTLQMQDAGMIHMNASQIANLPQEVMIKRYPDTGAYLPNVLDDTMVGVDRQMDYDNRKRSEGFAPKKV